MTAIRSLVAATALLLGGGAALAHHSFARFDSSKEITIEGTISKWEWSNPHTWLYLVTRDAAGAMVTIGIEGNSPNNLIRAGVKKSVFKIGDKAIVTMHPERNPEVKEGSLVKVISVNGTPFVTPGVGTAAAPP
jgi:hypothetical protein